MAGGFDGQTGTQFVDYYEKVRGYVREELTRRNLEPYLRDAPEKTALDVGGGDGRDSVWLAQKGFRTTLVDVSADMIRRAEERRATLAVPERELFDVNHVPASELTTFIDGRTFDLVLSHGVLMYCLGDEAPAHLEVLATAVSPVGGILSLLTKGYVGGAQTAVNQRDKAALSAVKEAGEFHNNLGVQARAFSPEQVIKMLGSAGMRVANWSGVRIVTDSDTRPVADVDPEELAMLVEIEGEVGRNPHCRGAAQMLHFIATQG